MIYLVQVNPTPTPTPTANPTFISSYGPLIAALVALIGVFTTLIVNGKRDQARYHSEREDDYRREQRTAIAAVIVAAHNLHMLSTDIVKRSVINMTTEEVESANTIIAAFRNDIAVATLLIHDALMQEALGNVSDAGGTVVIWTELLMKREKGGQEKELQVAALKVSLPKFDGAISALQGEALERLKPTILEKKNRIVHLISGGHRY